MTWDVVIYCPDTHILLGLTQLRPIQESRVVTYVEDLG
jgi:hypothetical protein